MTLWTTAQRLAGAAESAPRPRLSGPPPSDHP